MSIKVTGQRCTKLRELGRIGTAGSFIAAFGLLWAISYFVVVSWLTSLLVDSYYYFWQFTNSFGWAFLLAGGIVFIIGAGLMASDWKCREPARSDVQEEPKGAASYDALHPHIEYHVEA